MIRVGIIRQLRLSDVLDDHRHIVGSPTKKNKNIITHTVRYLFVEEESGEDSGKNNVYGHFLLVCVTGLVVTRRK